MLVALSFYVFALVLLVSAAAVVTCRNPVHSVLCLILAFFNAAALFLIAGAEFLAMILVIVYVGAVAVLFLFVVMMLDVNFSQLREGFQRYLPVGATVGAVLFVELALVLGGWKFAPDASVIRPSSAAPNIENTRALGQLIYTNYVFLFQAAGMILMVAMIGAIVLTHRDKTGSKRQVIAKQNARQPAQSMEVMHVPTGVGTNAAGGFLRPRPEEPTLVAANEPHGHGAGPHGPGEH